MRWRWRFWGRGGGDELPGFQAALHAVEQRVDAFVAGDEQAVLGERAVADARALWEAGTRADGWVATDAVHALALLAWLRHLAVSVGADQEDFVRAIELFDMVHKVEPDAVPEPVRPFLTGRELDTRTRAAWAGRASALLEHAMAEDDPDALDAGIDILDRCAGGAPEAERGEHLANLSVALLIRGERTGVPADIESAVQAAVDALNCECDDRDRAGRLNNHANALSARAERGGGIEDLRAAVAALCEAAGVADHPDRSMFRSNLALSLLALFRRTELPEDLEAAEDAARAAVTGDRPESGGYLSNLALILTVRYEQSSDPAWLDEAIELGYRALRGAPTENFDLARTRATLGVALAQRFDHTGTDADLTAAIKELQAAERATITNRSLHATVLVNLSVVLLSRYERSGAERDLDAALRAAGAPAVHEGRQHVELPATLMNHGNALQARYERTGDAADLGAAVAVYRQAANLPQPALSRARVLSNLGAALHTRYEDTDQLSDLNEAIDAYDGALRATPSQHVLTAVWSSNLATAWMARFERSRDPADLESALETFERLHHQAPPGHPDFALRAGNLGSALDAAATAGAAPQARDRAIDLLLRAAAELPPDHPDRALYTINACAALHNRYERGRDLADLERAITEVSAVLAEPVGNISIRAIGLRNLANAQLARAECGRAAGEPWEHFAKRAIEAGTRALEQFLAPAETRIGAARECALAAALLDDRPQALRFYRTAVELMARLALQGTERLDRERIVGGWQGLAGEAAAYAVECAEPAVALEVLEAGRAVLWNQLVRNRTEIDDVLDATPEAGAELLAQLRILDPVSVARFHSSESDTGGSDPEWRRARAIEAGRRFDSLVDEIRETTPGLDRFMRGPGAEQLAEVVTGGEVVVVNVAARRCDAIVVDHSGVRSIPLPALSRDDAIQHAERYLDAIGVLESTRRGKLAKTAAAQQVQRTLRWLWRVAAEPTLAELGHLSPVTAELGPRVWWCATGALAALPLHAAGDDTDDRHPVPHVLDLVISSYTPTVDALRHRARTRSVSTGPSPGLFVGMPQTAGELDLPQVETELSVVSRRYPTAVTTQLIGPDATRHAVLEALADHRWAHLSCHGRPDRAEPSAAGLVLHDGTLTVAEVADRDDGSREFVFLSACHTHSGRVIATDEVISLAAALAYTGWRDTVATLWSVYAERATITAERFYRALDNNDTTDSAAVARALHTAVRLLRAEDRRPHRWGAFIHIGG